MATLIPIPSRTVTRSKYKLTVYCTIGFNERTRKQVMCQEIFMGSGKLEHAGRPLSRLYEHVSWLIFVIYPAYYTQ